MERDNRGGFWKIGKLLILAMLVTFGIYSANSVEICPVGGDQVISESCILPEGSHCYDSLILNDNAVITADENAEIRVQNSLVVGSGSMIDGGELCINCSCEDNQIIEAMQTIECKVDVELVLDRSGSMNDVVNGNTKIQLLKGSSTSFVNKMLNASNPELDNLIGLTSFSHTVVNEQNLTNNPALINNRINALIANGATNYNESIRIGVNKIVEQNRDGVPRFLVFLSDGNPTVPINTIVSGGTTDPIDIESAIEAANFANTNDVPLITVGLGNNQNLNVTLLQQMADITGGFTHIVDPNDGLNVVFDQILEEVCNPVPFCGDNVTQPEIGEECDDGNSNSGDGCSEQCVFEFCGDSVLHENLGEQCDDGNLNNGDGCSDECLLEPDVVCEGDNIVLTNGSLIQNCNDMDFVEDLGTFCTEEDVVIGRTVFHDFSCVANGEVSCLEINVTEIIEEVEDCNELDENSTGLACTGESVVDRTVNTDFGCSGGQCVVAGENITEDEVENCDLRDGMQVNQCGSLDWSCAEFLNDVKCVITDIDPVDDLCAENFCSEDVFNFNGTCNPETFHCEYEEEVCEVPETEVNRFCDGDKIIEERFEFGGGCSPQGCLFDGVGIVEEIEDCSSRNGEITNQCGVQTWTCNDQGEEPVCEILDVQPDENLCNGGNGNLCVGNKTLSDDEICNPGTFSCEIIGEPVCIEGSCGAVCDSVNDFGQIGNSCFFGCDLENSCGFTGEESLNNFCQENIRHFNGVCTANGSVFETESCSDKNFIEEVDFCDDSGLKHKKILHEFTCAPEGCQEATKIIEITDVENCDLRDFNESSGNFCSGNIIKSGTIFHDFSCVASGNNASCQEISVVENATDIENCDERDGSLRNECGIEDWSCAESNESVECVINNVNAETDLCESGAQQCVENKTLSGGEVCNSDTFMCELVGTPVCVEGSCGATCDSVNDFKIENNQCIFGCSLDSCGFSGNVSLNNFCQNNVRHFNGVCTATGADFEEEDCSSRNFAETEVICSGSGIINRTISHIFSCAPEGCQETIEISDNLIENCDDRDGSVRLDCGFEDWTCSSQEGTPQCIVDNVSPESELCSDNEICSNQFLCEPVFGCIDVKKETFDSQNNPITPVPQFTFSLDGGLNMTSNSNGDLRFLNVTPGQHQITEIVPDGWELIQTTPSSGTVNVQAGEVCSTVLFKNKQSLPETFCDGGILKQKLGNTVTTIENCDLRDFIEDLGNSCNLDTVVHAEIIHDFSCIELNDKEAACEEIQTNATEEVENCNLLDGDYCFDDSSLRTRDYTCSAGQCIFVVTDSLSCGTDGWTGGENLQGFEDPACVYTNFFCSGEGKNGQCFSSQEFVEDFDNLDEENICMEFKSGNRDFFCQLNDCDANNPEEGCSFGVVEQIDSCSFSCGAECETNNDCQPFLQNDQCSFNGECSSESCGCSYVSEFCPQPGTVDENICYFGSQACGEDGCAIQSCILAQGGVCDSQEGCLICEDRGVILDEFNDGSTVEFEFGSGGGSEITSFNVPKDLEFTSARMNVEGQKVNVIDDNSIDAILVTDVSGSMAGLKIAAAKQADIEFINLVMNASGNNIGLVAYSFGIIKEHPLSSDKNSLINQVNSYVPVSTTCISCGVQKAIELSGGTNEVRAMVVMSDGIANRCIGGVGCTEAQAKQEAINKAEEAFEGHGIKVFTVAFGDDADLVTLQQMAQVGNGSFRAAQVETIIDIFREIAFELSEAFPTNVRVDIGEDNIVECEFSGELKTLEDCGFTASLNSLAETCSCTGCTDLGNSCAISVKVSSESTGKVVIRDLEINACEFIPQEGIPEGPPQPPSNGTNHLVFSEIFYDTPGNDAAEEWLEIHNPTELSVNLLGWKIEDNNAIYNIPEIIVPGGKSILIGRNNQGFKDLFGEDLDVQGLTLSLGNSGDFLKLLNGTQEIDFVAWEEGASDSHPQWTVSASTGKSIQRIPRNIDTDSVDDWQGNRDPEPEGIGGGVIGSTSITLDSFTFELSQGWNLISFPLELGNWSIHNVLEDIDGNYNVVMYYSAETNSWQTYSPLVTGSSSLNEFELGKGYWVNMNNDAEFEVVGEVAENVDIELFSGWNLIGYPVLSTQQINDILAGVNYNTVMTFDAVNQNWMTYSQLFVGFNDFEEFMAGRGYWVNSLEERTIVLP